MIDLHPERRRLERFMRGELPGENSKDIVMHLLSGCESCRRIARESFPLASETESAVNRLPSEWNRTGEAAYSQVIDQVLPAIWEAEEALENERADAPQLFSELESHPHERRLLIVRNSRRFKNWALCELVIDQAFSEGFKDPVSATEFGLLAVAISESLKPTESKRELLCDLRSRAHSILGNALRISGSLADATAHFAKAEEWLSIGTGEPCERARFLELKSYLAGESREFSKALSLLEETIRIYHAQGEHHRLGRTLIIKGHQLGEKGDVAGAVESLRQGLTKIDETQEPRLVLVAKHNLVRHLYQAGRYHQAIKLLPETRALHQQMGSEMDQVRFNWLEAMILRDSNELGPAEQILQEVKAFFVDRGVAHDSALVSLDLAAIYLRQQRTAELKELATEMLTIFRALRVNREAIAALVLFQKAVEMENVSLGLMRDLAAYLKASRHDARLPFRPGRTS